jgi:hypothetical protein
MMRSNRPRSTWLAILLMLSAAAILAPLSAQQPTEKKTTIADLTWISGAWVLEHGGTRTEETWSPAASNAILGMSRTLRGDRMVAFEFLRIVQRNDGIFYVAQPGGRPATDFKLTSFDGSTAIFENPQHDFPKRILYTRNPDGSLTARIDAGAGVTEGAMDFPFKRR